MTNKPEIAEPVAWRRRLHREPHEISKYGLAEWEYFHTVWLDGEQAGYDKELLYKTPQFVPYPETDDQLFDFIAHGDDEHRAWLRAAIAAFRGGEPRPEMQPARAPAPQAQGMPEPTVGDLAALVARLVRALRKAAPGHELAEKAADYLKRKRLLSPLRSEAQAEVATIIDGKPTGYVTTCPMCERTIHIAVPDQTRRTNEQLRESEDRPNQLGEGIPKASLPVPEEAQDIRRFGDFAVDET